MLMGVAEAMVVVAGDILLVQTRIIYQLFEQGQQGSVSIIHLGIELSSSFSKSSSACLRRLAVGGSPIICYDHSRTLASQIQMARRLSAMVNTL